MCRRKGRGSPPIPWPSVFTASGWRPDRISRSGRGRRPPRRRSRRSERVKSNPLRGRMGRLCVQANLSTWHGVSRGGTGAARPRSGGPADPHAGPRRTDRIQRGPRRSRALSGPPWSASGGWGSGRGRPLPVETGGVAGASLLTPLEQEPDRDHAAEPAPAQARRAPARPGRPEQGRGAPCAQATTSTNAANCGDPRRGGTCRVAGPQPDGRDHHLLEHVEARRRRLREEAGRARGGRRQRSRPGPSGLGIDDGEVDASVREVDDELPVVDIVEGSAEAGEDVAGVVLKGGP